MMTEKNLQLLKKKLLKDKRYYKTLMDKKQKDPIGFKINRDLLLITTSEVDLITAILKDKTK